MELIMRILISLVVFACALPGALSYAQWLPGAPELPSKSGDLKYLTSSGRFQVFVSPQAKESTFMLDTQTGRLWIMKKDHSSGEFSMQRVPVADLEKDSTPKTGTGDKNEAQKPSGGTEPKK
jgi:hypothetical protein